MVAASSVLDRSVGASLDEVEQPLMSWVGRELTAEEARQAKEAQKRRSRRGAGQIPDPVSNESSEEAPDGLAKENVAFVRSPTVLVPDIHFEPKPAPSAGKKVRRTTVLGVAAALAIGIALAALALGLIGRLSALGALFEAEEAALAAEIGAPQLALVVRNGSIHIEGAVPTQELRNELIERVAGLTGGEVVADDLRVEPGATLDRAAATPLRLGETVLFASGRAAVEAKWAPLIETAATILVADGSLEFSIVGHTDSVGSEADNAALSLERAEAVRRSLVDLGVGVDQLTASGRGETEPIASNSGEAGRAANRRVVFTVSGLLD